MKEPDIKEVEQRLATVLNKERKEAIGYTVVTILCTPAFVVIASVMIFIIMAFIFRHSDYMLDTSGIYTGFNIFLALMIVFVLRSSNPPEEPHDFDKRWLAAVGVFIVLLILTYSSGFREQFPVFFGIVYAVVGFFVLGLLGHVQMNNPVTESSDSHSVFLSFILAVFGFIAMSYGEISRGSWLWFPPEPDEIRVCAWILCRLAMENTWKLSSRAEQRRVLSILARLKLVKMTDNKLQLTLKGWDFVGMDIQGQFSKDSKVKRLGGF